MWDISIFPIFTLFPWSAGGVYNDISATRAAVNIWICRESLLIFSSLCAPQVTDGATAQTAGSGHEYIKQASPDWDMCIGMDPHCVPRDHFNPVHD